MGYINPIRSQKTRLFFSFFTQFRIQRLRVEAVGPNHPLRWGQALGINAESCNAQPLGIRNRCFLNTILIVEGQIHAGS